MRNTLLLFSATAIVCSACFQESDVAVADRFANESYVWTQQLTVDGQELGTAIFDVIEGKGTPERAASLKTAMLTKVQAKIAEIQAAKLPDIPELHAYRASLIAYLNFQISACNGALEQALVVASDAAMPIQERGVKVVELVMSGAAEETRLGEELEAATKTLYAELKTR